MGIQQGTINGFATWQKDRNTGVDKSYCSNNADACMVQKINCPSGSYTCNTNDAPIAPTNPNNTHYLLSQSCASSSDETNGGCNESWGQKCCFTDNCNDDEITSDSCSKEKGNCSNNKYIKNTVDPQSTKGDTSVPQKGGEGLSGSVNYSGPVNNALGYFLIVVSCIACITHLIVALKFAIERFKWFLMVLFEFADVLSSLL